MISKRVVILNGPPNSGKDYLAELVCWRLGKERATKHQFKTPLYFDVAELFGVTVERFIELCDSRATKETPCDELIHPDTGVHLSPRQALIYTSEDVMKSLHGKDHYGKIAAATLDDGLNIFSDGGFVEEMIPLIDEVGRDNFSIVHIAREGTSFSGDSRRYIDLSEYGARCPRVYLNNEVVTPNNIDWVVDNLIREVYHDWFR